MPWKPPPCFTIPDCNDFTSYLSLYVCVIQNLSTQKSVLKSHSSLPGQSAMGRTTTHIHTISPIITVLFQEQSYLS